MKTTLVMQDGISQIVLTPEIDIERDIIKMIDSSDIDKTVKIGSFSECSGGWIRYFGYMSGIEDDCSIMLVLKDKKK